MHAYSFGYNRFHLGVGLAQGQSHRVPAHSVLPAQAGQGITPAAELVFDPEGVNLGWILWRRRLHRDINKSN